MTWPNADLPNEWTDGEDENAVILYYRITQRLNQLRAAQQIENRRSSLTIPNGSALADLPITFNQTWNVAPNVQVTVQTAAGRFAAVISAPVTTTGFTVRGYVYNGSNVSADTTITIAWLATAQT